MRLDLKVIHTPDTKSKKPWKKIHWLGSQSDILLKAYSRLKVLHLQDKNLKKKKISKLQSILKKLCICNISQNGNYVVGIIDTGGIIVWSRLDDTTRTINGPAALVEYFEGKQQQQNEFQASHKTKVFISNDARNILVVLNLNQIFLWQASQQNFQSNAKEIDKGGNWYTIARSSTPLPPSHSVDACVDSVFFEDAILGKCNISSFVFYKGSYLQVSSVLIKWLEPWKRFIGSNSFFNVSWHSMTIPVDIISPGCQPLHQDGALVASHSTNGLLLAVAVNQDSPRQNRVLFLSVLSHSMVNVNLKSCGCKNTEPNKDVARTYWVADCSWNHDNLFLACIMKKGSVFLLSRLGELLQIQTDGCSVEHGPDLFIPLHPLISIIPSKNSTESKQVSGDTLQDVNLQIFSVAFHPSLPLLVCSDGFLATVMELPSMISCAGLIREFLGEGKSAINHLCEQFLPKVKQLPTLRMDVNKSIPLHLNDMKEASMSKFLSTDSSGLEFGYAGPFAGLTEGKIIFGSPQSPNSTTHEVSSSPGVLHISRRAERMLLLAWLCGSSQYTQWDPQLETLLVFTAKCLAKFCFATSRLRQREENFPHMPVDTFQKSLSILSWDLTHVHILCSAVQFVHQTVVNILSAKPALTVSSLTHSVALLIDCEAKLHHIYSLRGLTTGSFMPDENIWHIGDEVGCYQTYDSFSDLQTQYLEQGGRREADAGVRRTLDGDGCQDGISRSVLPTWKVLYQKTIMLYSALSEHVKTSRRTEQLFLLRMRRFLVNLLGVLQRKLCSGGCHVSLHIHQFWTAFLDETYLRGCENFMMGDLLGATRCWQVAYDTSQKQTNQLGKSPTQNYLNHRQLQEKCLLAILYSSLMSYNLSQALELANSAIESVSVDAKKLKVKRSFKQLLEDKTTVTLPIIKGSSRSMVMSLGRFMALYFTNKPLVVYMPSTDRPLPALFSESKGPPDLRMVAIHQHLIASNIHEQGISDLWTPDVALNLLLITGLFPEAVWFSREVGDWKSAFTLSVIYSMKYDLLTADHSHRSLEELSLPDDLSALTLIQERLTALMEVSDSDFISPRAETPRTPKARSSPALGMMENSESAAEEMTQSLSDIFLATTLSGLEVVPWLLGNILQQCLLTVSKLSCVVHEKYYLPAPPYYCPQPDYSPTDEDPEEVVEENASRRKITLLVKQMLLVLECSHCSRVSARWYVEQLDHVLTWAFAKKKTTSQDLPNALQQQINYPLDIMEGLDSMEDIHPGTKFILKCFRDLSTMLWMLHSRDKLSEALRKGKAAKHSLYTCKRGDSTPTVVCGNVINLVLSVQHAKEVNRSVQKEDIPKNRDKVKSRLKEILLWGNLFQPFSDLFQQKDEIKDIILTTITELDLTKETVATLANTFYDEATLPAVVAEKFQRLKRRLSQKKVYQEIKIKKRENNDGKDSVKSISLLMYFKLQCKMRKLALKSMSKAFGDLEEAIFVGVDGDSRPTVSPLHVQYLYDSENSVAPVVGNREFEYSKQFLNFLETFFLVTLGSLPADKQPNLSIPLPLVQEYYHDVCNKELGLKLKKVPVKNECDVIVNTDHLAQTLVGPRDAGLQLSAVTRDQSEDLAMDGGLFQRNFCTYTTDDVVDMSQWRSSIDEGVISLSHNKVRVNVEKGSFLALSINMDLAKANILFGSVYSRLQKLLNWLKLWPEKQHSALTGDEIDEKLQPRNIMKLHPPNILVVLGLWLLRQHLQGSIRGEEFKLKGREGPTKDGKSVGGILKHGGSSLDSVSESKRRLPEVKPENIDTSSSEVSDTSSSGRIVSPISIESDVERKSVRKLEKQRSLSNQELLDKLLEDTDHAAHRKKNAFGTLPRSKSARRVLPKEPDVEPVSPRQTPQLKLQLFSKKSLDASITDKRKPDRGVGKIKTDGSAKQNVDLGKSDKGIPEVKTEKEQVLGSVPGERTDRRGRTKGILRRDVNIYMDDSSSNTSPDVSDEDLNEEDDTFLVPTELSSHLNRDSSFGRYDKMRRIPSISEDTMGIHSSHSSLRLSISDIQREDGNAWKIPSEEKENKGIQSMNGGQRSDEHVEVFKKETTHQQSQTVPVGIRTLEAPSQTRDRDTTTMEPDDLKKDTSAQTQETNDMENRSRQFRQQMSDLRTKYSLKEYIEARRSDTSKETAMGLPFPLLTLPNSPKSDIQLDHQQSIQEFPQNLQGGGKGRGPFPLLTLDRDVSPVIQMPQQRVTSHDIHLPLLKQTSFDEVKQAHIRTVDPSTRPLEQAQGRPAHLKRLEDEPYGIPLLTLDRPRDPPQLLVFQGEKHSADRDQYKNVEPPLTEAKNVDNGLQVKGASRIRRTKEANAKHNQRLQEQSKEEPTEEKESRTQKDEEEVPPTSKVENEDKASIKEDSDKPPSSPSLDEDEEELQQSEKEMDKSIPEKELDGGSLGNSWSTPAATHLSIVKKLTATKTSDASTSMSAEDIAPKSEPPKGEPTKDKESSFLVSGLMAVNRVVAPKIFMGYEKERTSMNEVKKAADKDPAEKSVGKSFLSVVDMGADILRNLLSQNKKSSPDDVKTDSDNTSSETNKEPPQDSLLHTGDVPLPTGNIPIMSLPDLEVNSQPAATNAELHYKSLFLRDANSHGPLEEEQDQIQNSHKDEDSSSGRTGGAVFNTILDEKLKLLEDTTDNIGQDLKNTKNLLQTVDDVTNSKVYPEREEESTPAPVSISIDVEESVELPKTPPSNRVEVKVKEDSRLEEHKRAHKEESQLPQVKPKPCKVDKYQQSRSIREKENYQVRVKEAREMMSEILADTPPALPPPVAPKPKRKVYSKDGSRPGTRQSGGTGSRVGHYQEKASRKGQQEGLKLSLEASNEKRSHQDQVAVPKFRPFTEIVNLQRPSATRRATFPKKSKTYAEMLKDLKTETYGRPTDAQMLTKSDLHGTKSSMKQTFLRRRTYSERLREVRGEATRPTSPTKLQRVHPRQHAVPRVNTGATRRSTHNVTMRGSMDGASTRRIIESRGISRTDTPFQDKKQGPPVSPRPVSVMKSRGRSHEPVPYVQRLQQAKAQAPLAVHKDVYVFPTSTYTFKSPTLHSSPTRHQPYMTPRASIPRAEDEMDMSDISSWSVSDDVKRILYQDANSDISHLSDKNDFSEQDSYLSAVDVRELENRLSIGSGSSLSINWNEVDEMVATVE